MLLNHNRKSSKAKPPTAPESAASAARSEGDRSEAARPLSRAAAGVQRQIDAVSREIEAATSRKRQAENRHEPYVALAEERVLAKLRERKATLVALLEKTLKQGL